MSPLRGKRRVEQTLRRARQDVRSALKELNRYAGRLMARGDYVAAGEFADRGRGISEFEGRLDVLRREWLTLWNAGSSGEGKDKETATPLWEYYQPVLATLEACGGEASRRELERNLEVNLMPRLKPGDLRIVGRERIPRWKLMVRRARTPMIRENYLESKSGKHWRITALGRQVAQGSVKVPAGV